MVEIFAVNKKIPISNKHYQYLLTCASEEKQKRIEKFHFIEDAKRTLYGDVLIRYLACEKLNISNDEIVFFYNDCGKPFLKGYPFFYFNISHAGDWVVCAISNDSVGIDVEQIKSIEFQIAENFFSTIEYVDLIYKPQIEQMNYFYDLWTLKESYVKYMGKGLSIPFNSFSFRVSDKHIDLDIDTNHKLHFKQFVIEQGYKLTVCSEDKDFCKSIVNINIQEIKFSRET